MLVLHQAQKRLLAATFFQPLLRKRYRILAPHAAFEIADVAGNSFSWIGHLRKVVFIESRQRH